MGKVLSLVMRPARKFNIDNRARRVISKEKPTPAPQYPSVEQQRKVVDELFPDFKEKQARKDMQLDSRLKDVYVVSNNPELQPHESETTTSRQLPQDRGRVIDFDYGYYEPSFIPEGKCTIRQAITFISDHEANPAEHSLENIASKYRLDKEITKNILYHFKTPQIYDIDKAAASMLVRDDEP